jgi:energy-coupling factor transport system permease protein
MSLLMPGVHVPADTCVHTLDPRVKLGVAVVLMVLPFWAPGLASALLLSTFVLGVVILARVPPLSLLRTLRTVFWIGLFMFVFYALTTPGDALVSVGTISVTGAGLLAGVTLVYRLCALVIIGSLLTYTTSPGQLAHGLETVLSPLARLRLPVREASMVLTIALRFVPTMSAQIDRIVTAQRARGAEPMGNPVERVQSWVPMFVPIFVLAFRRAEQLAMAMEARGYRGAGERTRLKQLRFSWQDLVAVLVALAAVLAIAGAAYL